MPQQLAYPWSHQLWGHCPSITSGVTSWGVVLRPGRGRPSSLGPTGAPIWVVPAPAGSGETCHSLPWLSIKDFLLPGDINKGGRGYLGPHKGHFLRC